MNSFWAGSAITLLILTPIVVFLLISNGQNTTPTPEVAGTQLEEPGQLPKEIFTVNEKCADELANSGTGVISADCINYEANLTSDFMSKVKEAVENEDDIECAQNLPKDLSALHKKIEGERAEVLIEGNQIVNGEDENSGDLQVEFIRTEDDWEISDIRCLN